MKAIITNHHSDSRVLFVPWEKRRFVNLPAFSGTEMDIPEGERAAFLSSLNRRSPAVSVEFNVDVIITTVEKETESEDIEPIVTEAETEFLANGGEGDPGGCEVQQTGTIKRKRRSK